MIEQSLGFIYGPPGCLKTFIALDMALSFATGAGQWWGRPIARRRRRDLHFQRGAGRPQVPHHGVGAAPQGRCRRRAVLPDPAEHQFHDGRGCRQAAGDGGGHRGQGGEPIAAVFVDTVSPRAARRRGEPAEGHDAVRGGLRCGAAAVRRHRDRHPPHQREWRASEAPP